ncbi:hypothetical protein WICPIJ_006728 [Wickerhamomyces pijperi]|uniref:Uncharacterized protein n=1 Tax=Wickerhamomyces pijperi TaxID=599730 RepID=A0A9P8Q1K7_WICPI|nr:hypothetical protein WICPIJ_006728 [Wickerhamomyces pijperi]
MNAKQAKHKQQVNALISSRDDKDQDTGVDQVVQAMDLGILDSNDKRRSIGRGGSLCSTDKQLVVVRNTHTQQQNGTNVENNNTVESQSDGLWDISTRIFSLGNGDTN